MKAGFMQRAMWTIFKPSFKKELGTLGVIDSKIVMRKARKKYFAIIESIPKFEKNDVLEINILSAATFAAVYLSLEHKPNLEEATQYYDNAMSGNTVMRIFLKSNNYYSKKYQKKLASQGERSQKSNNPYSWRFRYYAGETLDNFDAIFDRCGICTLFNTLRIAEITPALCAYDYGMAKHTNTIFTREYTLASGGSVCDCHYRNRNPHKNN